MERSKSTIEWREIRPATLKEIISELRTVTVPEGTVTFKHGQIFVSYADWIYILNAAEDKLNKETK